MKISQNQSFSNMFNGNKITTDEIISWQKIILLTLGEQYTCMCDPIFDMLELTDELVYTLDGHKTVFNQSKENTRKATIAIIKKLLTFT